MSSNAGTYNFNSDAANPLDTNLGWANALLGHLNTYTENNNNTRSMPRFNQPEFFVQDNWRLNRRFTLDVGVRFSHIGVVREPGRDIGWFDPTRGIRRRRSSCGSRTAPTACFPAPAPIASPAIR